MSALPLPDRPALFLAPMQDITDRAFIGVVESFGGADVYVTEYFRVHGDSRLDPSILSSITKNETSKPILAQMIGQDVEALRRTALELQNYPVAGIDLNLGCPAPVVCRKEAGGALLRNLAKLDRILGTLRDCCEAVPFTLKTRLGYDSADEFEGLLELFAKHQPDLLSVHGRTVKDRYQTMVRPDSIREAVSRMDCPVIANGNVVDTSTGLAYLEKTQAAGLMIGRGAIRHPWLFEQLRRAFLKKPPLPDPTRKDLLGYIRLLYEETASTWRDTDRFDENKHVQKMKKYLNFISQGLPAEFEYGIRRARTPADFFTLCEAELCDDTPLPQFPSESSKLFCGFKALLQ